MAQAKKGGNNNKKAAAKAAVKRSVRNTKQQALPKPQIFISYRRRDSHDEAFFLRSLLVKKYGADSVFHDISSIELGDNFKAAIENAISSTTVVLALVGRRWLKPDKATGGYLKMDEEDYVRFEIETAIRFKKLIIPVFIDGVQKLPDKKYLPVSIEKFISLEGIAPFDAFDKLNRKINSEAKRLIEKKKAEEEAKGKKTLYKDKGAQNYILKSLGQSIVIRAMELSLKQQHIHVTLDEKDLVASLKKIDKISSKYGGVVYDNLIYIIDMWGIKQKNSVNRYVARSYRLRSMEDLALHTILRRPVITSLTIYENWLEPETNSKGLIDTVKEGSRIIGSTIIVIIDWEPEKEIVTAFTSIAALGKNGIVNIKKDIVKANMRQNSLRAIEAAKMPVPYSYVNPPWAVTKQKS